MSGFDFRRTWGPKPKYPKVLSIKPQEKNGLMVVAGPCSVEDEEQINKVVPVLKKAGVHYARGGVFRAGTYPGKEFGLRSDLLEPWGRACQDAGLKTVLEVLDVRQDWKLDVWADAFQVGARHMQDYVLLKALSNHDKPVFLKRNMGATLDEFLGAAEYLARGRCSPILVERGSATHANHVRWDLSISLIAAVKKMTGLPILVDASHGTGRSDLVEDMTLAGIAAGADGFIVEVHPNPSKSLSDANQALPLDRLKPLIARAMAIREARII